MIDRRMWLNLSARAGRGLGDASGGASPVDAIVPAKDEERTIGTVASVLVAAGCFRRVLVVDDGSSDGTRAEALAAGAECMSLRPNRGKGGAMRAAIPGCAGASRIAFFDADLLGLRADHVTRLVALGRTCDMACGLRDYGPFWNDMQTKWPWGMITGERVVAPWILDRLPGDCWSGYKIETAMNMICQQAGGSVRSLLMDGVTIRKKQEKVGFAAGMMQHCAMLNQMNVAKLAMMASAGKTCSLGEANTRP